MQTDGLNKNIYHWLTTMELTTGLSLNIYTVSLKIIFPMEKIKFLIEIDGLIKLK